MDPMAEIRITFFQECEEQLGELEAGLLAIEAGEDDTETVNAVFRAVHSVKGGAGAFGLDALVRFAHVFETCMDAVRGGRLPASPDVVKALLRASDVLSDLVRAARDGGEADTARTEAIAAELAAFTGEDETAGGDGDGDDGMGDLTFQPLAVDLGPAPQTVPAVGGWRIRFRPRPALYRNANEPALLLRELARLGPMEVELDESELPLLPDLDPEGAYLAWTVQLVGAVDEAAVKDVFEFVEGDCDLEIDALTDAEPVEPAGPPTEADPA
ncbi:MAG: Hpt domain-containing protein, partial [Caulobacteraceae bacterium]